MIQTNSPIRFGRIDWFLEKNRLFTLFCSVVISDSTV